MNAPGTGCERVRARMVEQVEGELAPLDEALDRGHLEACAECACERAELERVRHGIRGLARVAEAELGVELALLQREVLARLPAHAPRAPGLRMRTVLTAAAALLLLFLWSRGGLPSAPRAADLANLDPWLERLPAWPELLHGLGGLLRPF
jgi:anti-sigma factor RsiW